MWDKRQQHRRELRFAVKLDRQGQPTGRLRFQVGVTDNLSQDGCLIRAIDRVAVGDEVVVRFRSADGRSTPVLGTVTRFERDDPKKGAVLPHLIGVRFRDPLDVDALGSYG